MRVGAIAVYVLALAACGRLGFTQTSGGPIGDANGDGLGDTVDQNSGACNRKSTAPDPLSITGHVFQYLNFNGTTGGLRAQLSARPSPLGQPITSTTSDPDGTYALSIETGGTPQTMWFDASLTGYLETLYWFDYPLEHPIAGDGSAHLHPGDVPMWTGSSMGSVYSSASLTRDDTTRGTLVVTVLDCNEMPVDGVEISTDPPIGTPTFLASNGFFDLAATTTTSPYSQASILNALPGAVTITASHPEHHFEPVDVVVSVGDYVSVVIIHTADPP